MKVEGTVICERYFALYHAAQALNAPQHLLNFIRDLPSHPRTGYAHLEFDTLPFEETMREPGQGSFRDRMIAQIVAQTLESK